jgi:guanylate kinase
VNHKDYHFISLVKFKQKIKQGEFLEWANNYGNLYGTAKTEINKWLGLGKNVLVVIDIKGALNIKKNWPKKSLIIFILPESFAQLTKRFAKRHDTTPADIKKRLVIAKWELNQAKKCDFKVINRENKIEKTVEKVAKIITG